MKAMTYRTYGSPADVLELADIDKPGLGDNDVLIRVQAASVNPLDWHLLTGTPYIARLQAGFRKPKRNIPGADVAGRVEAVGKAVTEFRPGDEVFGESVTGGGYAEFVSVPEKLLVLKPANLTFEQAAAVPVAAFTALQGLRDKGNIQPKHKVLIVGASGGVGTFAVQIAKSFGAEVTGVGSTRNVDMIRSIGADHVIDYTRADFAGEGQRYDLILDAVGNRSVPACRRALNPEGIYVGVGGPKKTLSLLGRMVRMALASMVGKKKMVSMLATASKEDLITLTELLETGAVTPVIDRTYSLNEVPEALLHQGEGHARGKTIITVER
jgi:NADPH:quinone reductase-like Zn-dependent oxidoreductase